MGRRYQAIFRYLGIEPLGYDLGGQPPPPEAYDSVLIATPTARHIEDIVRFAGMGKPILCEKPIFPDFDTVADLCDWTERGGVPLRMVNQYANLSGGTGGGITSYNYWNHGKDGLAWDCISLIALAKGKVELREDSPVWQCSINGTQHYASEMDFAYIDMIKGWVGGFVADIPYIRDAHRKVAAYLEVNP